jgi:hypothetical protein
MMEENGIYATYSASLRRISGSDGLAGVRREGQGSGHLCLPAVRLQEEVSYRLNGSDMHGKEESKAGALYQKIGDDLSNIRYVQCDGKTVEKFDQNAHGSIAQLSKVEEFVEKVIASDAPAFKLATKESGREVLEKGPLAEYFHVPYQFALLQFPGYRLSWRIQLFFECFVALELKNERFRQPRGYSSQLGKEPYQIFNEFINAIRLRADSAEFRRVAYDRKNNSHRNIRSAEDYIGFLYRQHRTLEVLRFEFLYLPEYVRKMSASDVKADVERFLNKRRGKSTLFGSCIGYFWAMQQGLEKGWFLHCFLFYPASHHYDPISMGESIGQYWTQSITQGRGCFYHRPLRPPACRAVPTSDGQEAEKAKPILLEEIRDLLASEQYIRANALANKKWFGKGEAKVNKTQDNKVHSPNACSAV